MNRQPRASARGVAVAEAQWGGVPVSGVPQTQPGAAAARGRDLYSARAAASSAATMLRPPGSSAGGW